MAALGGAVPLAACQGTGSHIVGDSSVCILSDGLQTQMAKAEDPPASRGYLVRKIAREESDKVKRYVSCEDLVRRQAAGKLRAAMAPQAKLGHEPYWEALAPYYVEPLCTSHGKREYGCSRCSASTRGETGRNRGCAFLTEAVGRIVTAAAKNRGRRAGKSTVRRPVILTSDRKPRPKQRRNLLEVGVATTIDGDACEMQTLARDGI